MVMFDENPIVSWCYINDVFNEYIQWILFMNNILFIPESSLEEMMHPDLLNTVDNSDQFDRIYLMI